MLNFFETDLKSGISFCEVQDVYRLSLFTKLLLIPQNIHHEGNNLSGCRKFKNSQCKSKILNVYVYIYMVFVMFFIYISSDNKLKSIFSDSTSAFIIHHSLQIYV